MPGGQCWAQSGAWHASAVRRRLLPPLDRDARQLRVIFQVSEISRKQQIQSRRLYVKVVGGGLMVEWQAQATTTTTAGAAAAPQVRQRRQPIHSRDIWAGHLLAGKEHQANGEQRRSHSSARVDMEADGRGCCVDSGCQLLLRRGGWQGCRRRCCCRRCCAAGC